MRQFGLLSAGRGPCSTSRVAATAALRRTRYAREVTGFFRPLALPSTRRAFRQVCERFEAHEQLRLHAGAGIERWLALQH